MRRRLLLLSAGLLAYFVGASASAYLRYPVCGDGEVGCRIVVVAENPRVALAHPLMAIQYLIAPVHLE
jgi:hypothetical protein